MNMMGVEGTPFFVGDGFAKLFTMPAGVVIGQHSHKVGHNSMLILGTVRLKTSSGITTHTAPETIYLAPYVAHEIESITPALWACVWPNTDGVLNEQDFENMVLA